MVERRTKELENQSVPTRNSRHNLFLEVVARQRANRSGHERETGSEHGGSLSLSRARFTLPRAARCRFACALHHHAAGDDTTLTTDVDNGDVHKRRQRQRRRHPPPLTRPTPTLLRQVNSALGTPRESAETVELGLALTASALGARIL